MKRGWQTGSGIECHLPGGQADTGLAAQQGEYGFLLSILLPARGVAGSGKFARTGFMAPPLAVAAFFAGLVAWLALAFFGATPGARGAQVAVWVVVLASVVVMLMMLLSRRLAHHHQGSNGGRRQADSPGWHELQAALLVHDVGGQRPVPPRRPTGVLERAMCDYGIVTLQRCCNDLRARHDAIVRTLDLPAYRDAATEQRKVVRHYLDRSRELARGSLLVADAGLTVPTIVFMRVLCEDLFLVTYAAASEENASRIAAAGTVAIAHMAAVNLERHRARILKTGTTEDHTSEVLPDICKMAADRFNIEQIARGVDLGGIYDVVYRSASLEVHGKTFGIFSSEEGEGAIIPALHAIIAILGVILHVADNCVLRGQPTDPAEIRRELLFG